MEQCRSEGRTASDVVRGFVEARLAGDAPLPGRLRRWFRPIAAAGMIGAIGLAMPAAVTAAPDFRLSYAAFDTNHDGCSRMTNSVPSGPNPASGAVSGG
jgi:hypothetical protein